MPYSLLSVPLGSFQVNELLFSEDIADSSFALASQEYEKLLNFSLIVPTYNESKNLAKLVEILTQLLNNYFNKSYELIIVDDDSPDLTWQVGLDLMPDYPQLRVMRRQGEKGLSTAVIRGWQASQGEILGVIDGDLQHPPETLIKMLNEMGKGADLVVASRHVEGGGVSDWGFIRRILSRGAQMLGLIILPNVIGRVSDPMSGYFMIRRSAIANRPMNPLGYKILIRQFKFEVQQALMPQRILREEYDSQEIFLVYG